MSQAALFAEDVNDALKDVVRALGGLKEVGRRLRPELAADAAGTWLKDCLNPMRRERLDPEQFIWLLREGCKVGCHSAMHFICDETSYARATPLEPKDEAAELQRQVLAATKSLETIAKRLERLQGAA